MNEQSWIILRDWNVYASWGVALLLVILLWWLAKKKVGFGLRVLLAMALGLTLGRCSVRRLRTSAFWARCMSALSKWWSCRSSSPPSLQALLPLKIRPS